MFTGKKLAMSVMVASAAVGLAAGPAFAGGNGAVTDTEAVHGSDAAGVIVSDFLPSEGGPTLPTGCWMPATDALVSTSGNGIQHFIGNKTGGWFTSTYSGGAAVYPIVFDTDGNPVPDGRGNDSVDMTGAALATGHLTTWFGNEANQKNGVMHATLTFSGVDSSGNAVSLSGHFQFATNAAGQPTAIVGDLSCSPTA